MRKHGKEKQTQARHRQREREREREREITHSKTLQGQYPALYRAWRHIVAKQSVQCKYKACRAVIWAHTIGCRIVPKHVVRSSDAQHAEHTNSHSFSAKHKWWQYRCRRTLKSARRRQQCQFSCQKKPGDTARDATGMHHALFFWLHTNVFVSFPKLKKHAPCRRLDPERRGRPEPHPCVLTLLFARPSFICSFVQRSRRAKGSGATRTRELRAFYLHVCDTTGRTTNRTAQRPTPNAQRPTPNAHRPTTTKRTTTRTTTTWTTTWTTTRTTILSNNPSVPCNCLPCHTRSHDKENRPMPNASKAGAKRSILLNDLTTQAMLQGGEGGVGSQTDSQRLPSMLASFYEQRATAGQRTSDAVDQLSEAPSKTLAFFWEQRTCRARSETASDYSINGANALISTRVIVFYNGPLTIRYVELSEVPTHDPGSC